MDALHREAVHQLLLTLKDDVYVAPSRLGYAAGFGLFAARPFRAGEILSVMDGVVLDDRQAARRPKSHMYTLMHGTLHVDGLRRYPPPPGRGLASYANDGNGPIPGHNNAAFHRTAVLDGLLPVCLLVATAPIARHDEVLVSYGGGYWKRE